MNDKVEANCPSCDSPIKIKVRRTISKLECKYCGFNFEAQEGKILTKAQETFNLKTEPYKEDTIPKEEADIEDDPDVDAIDFSEIVDDEPSKTPDQEKSSETENKKHVNLISTNTIPWKIGVAVLFSIVLVLSFLLYNSNELETVRKEKMGFSDDFLTALGNDRALANFESSKSYLDEESKQLFELLIEYQLSSSDTASANLTDEFLQSLNHTDRFKELLEFYYISKDMDTVFFYVEHVKMPDGSYQLKANIRDFLK